ncbi:uncharacterized protein LOC126283772 [Schistocerca gregaria]|uniref:uncharacterized protein LOC126283772 n=1 Tax=Schistocerca gregaria TaxID=7010 RepID=UPI00211DAB1B|nr:uncharacterized protein LOC126283772 [Schistocerca gregaria]
MFQNPSEELKERVKLALAIAIVRSKPTNITAKQVAVSLKKKLETEQSTVWRRKTDLNLRQRIQKLKHELLYSALPSESTNVSDFPLGGDIPGKDIPDGAEEDATEETEFHLMFIQSMVQLKSAVSTCTFLRASVLKTIVNSMTTDVLYPGKEFGAEHNTSIGDVESVYSLNTMQSGPQMTEDSGYSSVEVGKESDRKIPSSLLKYILCDSDANDLIVKSVETVLSYLEKSLSDDDEGTLEKIERDWRNSLLEDAVNILTDTVNILTQYDQGSGECRSACLGFIKKQIHRILTPSKISKYTTCECRCLIVCEMCSSLYLCSDTIEFLLEKVILLSRETVSACEADLDEYVDGVLVRETDLNFYMFYLLETLIVKYLKLVKIMKQSSHKLKEKPKPTMRNILELWRNKFCDKPATENTNCEEEDEHLSRINVWSSSLEQCLIKFSESNPKLTFAVWTSFEKLKENIQMKVEDT